MGTDAGSPGGMIGPDEARRIVGTETLPRREERTAVEEAVGRVLAAPLLADRPSPPFDRSAMDGYAVRAGDLEDAGDDRPVDLEVRGSVRAGGAQAPSLAPGEALRIFTGAPLPAGATAVVRQEEAERSGDRVRVRAPVPEGANVRPRGEEYGAGDRLLEEGRLLGPEGAALALGQGTTELDVYRPPRVEVVSTGDELVPADARPGPGQVRDTNGPFLAAGLRGLGVRPSVRRVGDDREEMVRLFDSALSRCDLLLVCGGVSVGEHDHVRETLHRVGVSQRFWKVRQKPGKPLYFGRRGDRAVLALPGNPVSTAVCFYLYGYPLVRRLGGMSAGRADLPAGRTRLTGAAEARRERRVVFAPARTIVCESGYRSTLVERRDSHMLSGLAGADSLVRIPPEASGSSPDLYTVYFLPEAGPRPGRRGEPPGRTSPSGGADES